MRGHDILTIQETGKAGQAIPDPEVLGFATSAGRAVLTLNRRHFIRLHTEAPGHAGIIVCTVDPDLDRQAERIHEALADAGDLTNRLIRVNRPAR